MSQQAEEDLRLALARRDAEAVELKEQLRQAAFLEKQLLGQNEELRGHIGEHVLAQKVVQEKLEESLSSTSRVLELRPVPIRGRASEHDASVRARSPMGASLPASSTEIPKSRTRSRMPTWEDWRMDRQCLEDEHERLRRRCEELEQAFRVLPHDAGEAGEGDDSDPSLPALLAVERRRSQQQAKEIRELKEKFRESEENVENIHGQLKHRTEQLQAANGMYQQLLGDTEKGSQHHNHDKEQQLQLTSSAHHSERRRKRRHEEATTLSSSTGECSRQYGHEFALGSDSEAEEGSKGLATDAEDQRHLEELLQENAELHRTILQLQHQLGEAEQQAAATRGETLAGSGGGASAVAAATAIPPQQEGRPAVQQQEGRQSSSAGGQSKSLSTLLTKMAQVRQKIDETKAKLTACQKSRLPPKEQQQTWRQQHQHQEQQQQQQQQQRHQQHQQWQQQEQPKHLHQLRQQEQQEQQQGGARVEEAQEQVVQLQEETEEQAGGGGERHGCHQEERGQAAEEEEGDRREEEEQEEKEKEKQDHVLQQIAEAGQAGDGDEVEPQSLWARIAVNMVCCSVNRRTSKIPGMPEMPDNVSGPVDHQQSVAAKC